MSDADTDVFVVPEIVASHFHLREGDSVADFGAGSGFFLPILAKRVGPQGKVYACEIQKSLIEAVTEIARKHDLHNLYPLWCDLEESHGLAIGDGALDVGVLINTLFLIEDKDSAVVEIGRTIRKGGKLIVIDWEDTARGLGPASHHIITAPEAAALFESHGFVLEQTFPAGGHHYGLAFRKV